MSENHPSDRELREKFQALRTQESEAAPSFSGILTKARRQSSADVRWRTAPLFIPLSAAALACLIAAFLLTNQEPGNPSLSTILPILLENEPERPALFDGLASQGTQRRFLSDDLLPLHLRIRL
jgi:hypothetical protein